MELNAVYIIITVTQCHDLSVITLCRNLQAVREAIAANDPTVVPSHYYSPGKPVEYRVNTKLSALGSHSMIDVRKIGQCCAKHFAYCLMSKAHT